MQCTISSSRVGNVFTTLHIIFSTVVYNTTNLDTPLIVERNYWYAWQQVVNPYISHVL